MKVHQTFSFCWERDIDPTWLGCKNATGDEYKVLPVLQPPDYTRHTTRGVLGDNNEAGKKVSRLLKLSWGEGRGRAAEKQPRIYRTRFVLIQAPQATKSSPRYGKDTKDFKIKIAHYHFQSNNPNWSTVISQLRFQKLYHSTHWAPAIGFSGSVTEAKAPAGHQYQTGLQVPCPV